MKTTKTLAILAAFGLLLVTANAQSFLTNGLVAYYPFAGNANDASGRGNDGVAFNVSYGTNRFALPSKSAFFKSSLSSSINLPSVATNLSGLSKATFAFWMKTTNLPTFGRCIFADWDETSGGIIINFFSGGLIDTINVSGYGGIITTNAIQTNSWHHYCVVFDGTQLPDTNIVSYYVDGVMVGKKADSFYAGMNTVIGTNTTCTLGTRAGNPNYYFTGWLDDFRIYNRAFSSNEVAALYNVESSPTVAIFQAVQINSSNLLTGINYQIQVSSDLINWTNSGSVFTASNTTATNFYPANWNQLFFRLQRR